MNYELNLGRSGCAVGLSAISLLAPLAKDAAPIPNALAAIKTRNIPKIQESVKIQKPVETPQG